MNASHIVQIYGSSPREIFHLLSTTSAYLFFDQGVRAVTYCLAWDRVIYLCFATIALCYVCLLARGLRGAVMVGWALIWGPILSLWLG